MSVIYRGTGGEREIENIDVTGSRSSHCWVYDEGWVSTASADRAGHITVIECNVHCPPPICGRTSGRPTHH